MKAQISARRARRRPNQKDRGASLSDHHIRCLDHRKRFVTHFEGEIVDRLVGDRRSDNDPTTDVDANMRRRLTFGDGDDLALELIAGAELHRVLLRCSVSIYPIGYHVTSGNECAMPKSSLPSASYTKPPAGNVLRIARAARMARRGPSPSRFSVQT